MKRFGEALAAAAGKIKALAGWGAKEALARFWAARSGAGPEGLSNDEAQRMALGDPRLDEKAKLRLFMALANLENGGRKEPALAWLAEMDLDFGKDVAGSDPCYGKRPNRYLPLSAAAGCESEVFKKALARSKGVDVSALGPNSPLHIAALRGRAENFKALAEAGAKAPGGALFNSELRELGACPLFHLACAKLRDEAALSAAAEIGPGFDPSARFGEKGFNALHAAALAGNLEALEFLERTGRLAGLLEEKDADGRTPLLVAAAAGQEGCAEKLLGAGADPAATDDWKRNLAFAAAESLGPEFLKKVPDPCFGAKNGNDEGPCESALYGANQQEAGDGERLAANLKVMMDKGLDPFEAGANGATAAGRFFFMNARCLAKNWRSAELLVAHPRGGLARRMAECSDPEERSRLEEIRSLIAKEGVGAELNALLDRRLEALRLEAELSELTKPEGAEEPRRRRAAKV